MEESPVDGSFDEEKFKRPVMKRSQIAVISSLHFGVSAQVSALACFIVPRVTFLSASRGHIAEAQGLLWLVVAVAHALARPMWAALSDRRSSRSWGRRRPYVVLGTVICGITFLALSVGGYHIPIAYYTLILSVYALGLSCLVVAWQALCAEIVRKEQARWVHLCKALWTVAGFAFGAGVLPCIADLIRIPTVYALLFAVMLASNILILRFNEPTKFTVPPSFRISTAWADLLEPFQSGSDFTLVFLAKFLSDLALTAFRQLSLYFIVDSIPKLVIFGKAISSPIIATGVFFIFSGVFGLPGVGLSRFLSSRWNPKIPLFFSGIAMAAAFCTTVLFQESYTAALVYASVFGFSFGAWLDAVEMLAREILPSALVDERPLGVLWLSPEFAILLFSSPLGAIVDTFVRWGDAGKGHAIVHGVMCGVALIATVLVAFVSRGNSRDLRRGVPTPDEEAEIWST